MGGADLGDGRAQLASEFQRVDVAAAGVHQVAHVEQNQRGQAESQNRRGQHQLAGQMQGVENNEHRVRLGRAGHFAAEYVDGDAGVFRIRSQRVDAGQVDQGEVVAAHAGHQAHALLDGDAGVVGHLLAQACQSIEKSGLAGVWRPDEHDGFERSGGGRSGGWDERRNVATGVHREASMSSGTSKLVSTSASGVLGMPFSAERTRMASAVSWRRAISMPSTP